MIGTVEHFDAHVIDRVAGENAARQRFLDTLVDRLDEFARNRAADGLVLELVARAWRKREQPNPAVAELAAAAGLALEQAMTLGRLGEGFLVSNLRLADARFDPELALESVNDNLKVQLAHAGDHHLAGLLVGLHAEGRVFGHQLLHADAEFFLVGLGLRLNGERNDRLREDHLLEDDRLLLVAQRVAGSHRLEADRGGDVAGVDFLDFLALVRVHLQQAADALGTALGGVNHRGTRGQRARVDAEEGELTNERVGHDLERQGRERLGVVRAPLDLVLVLRVGVDAGDRRDIKRRRQIIDDRVEHRLHTLVLEGGAANHGHERRLFLAYRLNTALAESGLQFGRGNGLAAQVFLEQLVIGLAGFFHENLVVRLGVSQHVGRNLFDVVVGAHRLVLVDERFHLDEVDHATKLVFSADRQLNGYGVSLQLAANLRERLLEVRTDAVHLVDEADARHAVLVRLAPHGLGLGLNTRHGVEHGNGTVEHTQRTFNFNREVDVARGVDDVDPVLLPEAGRRGRRNGDAALLLLLHPVHDGGAFVHFTDLVRDAGIEQDPFSRRGLAGINVGHDADVPRAFEWC